MRSEKTAIEREIREQVDTAESLFVVAYNGMNVAQTNELRSILRKEGASFRVFKNTFLRRSVTRRKLPESFGRDLHGMVAVVVAEDPVAAARSLQRFSVANKVLAVRGGILENRPLTAEDVAALAALPPRAEMLGRFVGVLAAPLARLVGVLNAAPGQLARVLQAIEGKKSGA